MLQQKKMMKNTLVLLVALLFTMIGFGQGGKKKNVFLVVRIEGDQFKIKSEIANADGFFESHYEKYYRINAEAENPYASDVYKLIPFIEPKGKTDRKPAGVNFYYNRNDTTTTYFNYFKTPTEALLFFSNKGWDLFTITTETYSNNPRYSIDTNTVYYFKKEIE